MINFAWRVKSNSTTIPRCLPIYLFLVSTKVFAFWSNYFRDTEFGPNSNFPNVWLDFNQIQMRVMVIWRAENRNKLDFQFFNGFAGAKNIFKTGNLSHGLTLSSFWITRCLEPGLDSWFIARTHQKVVVEAYDCFSTELARYVPIFWGHSFCLNCSLYMCYP